MGLCALAATAAGRRARFGSDASAVWATVAGRSTCACRIARRGGAGLLKGRARAGFSVVRLHENLRRLAWVISVGFGIEQLQFNHAWTQGRVRTGVQSQGFSMQSVSRPQMTIGRLAKAAGVGVETVRYYRR